MTDQSDPALLPVAEAPPQDDIMWRVERMIADTAHQMTIGTPLEREFMRGFNAAYHNIRNMLNEAASCAPRTPDEKGRP